MLTSETYSDRLTFWRNEARGMTELPQLALAAYAAADCAGQSEAAAAKSILLQRAGELGCRADLDRIFKALEAERARDAGRDPCADVPWLERTAGGRVKQTIGNYSAILSFDPFFESLRYDELAQAPVVTEQRLGKTASARRWTDADAAEAMRYIEETYGLYNPKKFQSAFRIELRSRRYHPIRELLEQTQWDGKARIERFLYDWAGCPDDAYTREASRALFAGGIHRLYEPGCKFDTVVVLIGTHQGEGKSTLVRWLALRDEWYGEITVLDGKEAVEQLMGKRICEMSEMLALTRTKDQEAIKSFISRQRDHYRRPYAENPEDLPRRGIMVGTTNNRAFLKDKTGNRRFLPVEVHCSGDALYHLEDDCRAYILQCWAEAREKYLRGELPAALDPRLRGQYRAAQEAAMEEDWRVGAIEQYLDAKEPGAYVCIRELWCEALQPDTDYPREATRKDLTELAQIMDRMPGWERVGIIQYNDYGRQRSWKKATEQQSN